MKKKLDETGVYQLKNGNWGFRYGVVVNGKTVWKRHSKDENGQPFLSKKMAIKSRQLIILKTKNGLLKNQNNSRVTVEEVWNCYCESGRSDKAYTTIKKQDSLWKNHIQKRFGFRYIDDISVGEINDYLSSLYYIEEKSFKYVESFLKMFYLIFGQAYSRDFLDKNTYDKLCLNKGTKIHMPKFKTNENTDIIIFSESELKTLDRYFKGTNAETAYLIGKYCGLRINECYGLKWENINFEEGYISIEQQMQYQDGLIKLVPLKTKNAKRKVYVPLKLKVHLQKKYEEFHSDSTTLLDQRLQNQTYISDVNDQIISSNCLVNTLKNGKIQTVNSMKYHSNKIKTELGINFKYHYLRHTYGTNLANNNVPSHILRSQMGHANINVTMQYYLGTSESGIDILKTCINKI